MIYPVGVDRVLWPRDTEMPSKEVLPVWTYADAVVAFVGVVLVNDVAMVVDADAAATARTTLIVNCFHIHPIICYSHLHGILPLALDPPQTFPILAATTVPSASTSIFETAISAAITTAMSFCLRRM